MFYDLGLLGSPKVHKLSVTDLVAGWVGQTGPKTREAFTKVRQAGCEWQLALLCHALMMIDFTVRDDDNEKSSRIRDTVPNSGQSSF
jgi:hypothetical protein